MLPNGSQFHPGATPSTLGEPGFGISGLIEAAGDAGLLKLEGPRERAVQEGGALPL